MLLVISCAMSEPTSWVNLNDPTVNCFTVKCVYIYYVSLVTSFEVCITFLGLFSVYCCVCSTLCVFIPFLPLKAKNYWTRKKISHKSEFLESNAKSSPNTEKCMNFSDVFITCSCPLPGAAASCALWLYSFRK